uniref:Uncharacterized protein n=1 Tax=Panagrolaimus sp. ES5 TaxID=591445 RepID=A0AC34FPA4_9BILA
MFLRATIVFHSFFDPGFCYDETKIWESSYKLVDFACYTARVGLFSNVNILYLVGIAEAGNLNGVCTYGASFYTKDPLTNQLARACFNFALLAYSIGLIIIIIYTIPVYRYKALDCQEVSKDFVQRNEKYYRVHSNDEIPDDMRNVVELDDTILIISGAAENDTSFLITTLGEHKVKWTFCRDDSHQCANKEQEFSVCYHNGGDNMFESKNDIDKECEGKRMCKIKVQLSKRDNFIFGGDFAENGMSLVPGEKCHAVNLYASSDETRGHIKTENNYDPTDSSTFGCKLLTRKLRKSNQYHTQIFVRQGKNNDGCKIKMFSYQSQLIIKGELNHSNATRSTKAPQIFESTEKSATAKFFDDWKYLIIVIVVIFIGAIIAAVVIKRKWLKKQFQKKKKNINSTAQGRGIGASEKQDTHGTTFDETTPYASNRQKLNVPAEKQTAQNEKKKEETATKVLKLAEKIAESHGFWINDRDPTVTGDEEEWLKNHADSLTKICVELHGVPIPDIGATHTEHLDYIDKHSLRDIYIIALYTEVEEPTRMFFLTSVIERFREVVKQIPTNELEKAPHPLPLLLRVYQEHPSVFGLRPLKKNNDKKPVIKKQ